MTKKQKLRRNSFAPDFNAGEDDFILADLDVMLNEEEPSPVPLNHFLDDEEIINRLLINPGFSANDQQDEDDRDSDALLVDDIDLADEFSGSNQFVVEAIERAEQNQQEVEKIPVSDIPLMADFDPIPAEEDAIDRLLVDDGFDANDGLKEVDGKPDALKIDDISRADEFDVNFDEQTAMTTDTGTFNLAKKELELDQDATDVFLVNEDNPKSVKPEQTGVETTAEIKPDLAIDSLNNKGINELNSFGTEHENIKKLIGDCENKVKKTAFITYASLGFGFVALLSMVAMAVIVFSMQTKISKLSDLVSILEEDMGSIAGKNPDLEINNSDSSLEQLNKKLNALPEHLEEQTQSFPGTSENETTADVTKQAAINKPVDNPHVPENKKPSEVPTKKVSSEKKSTNAQTAPSWSVNLTAFEDQSYAKGKAAKIVQKGIPVKVIAVDMNNKTWYRLKVGGFKNKEDASAYAAKIKKSLNLNSVSVVNN